MKTNFEHASIMTDNLEKSLYFYCDLLGGTVVREGVIQSSNMRLAYVQFGPESLIEILAPVNAERTGLDHIAFQVEDLDKQFEILKEAGTLFTVAPKTAGSGVGRLAFFMDPDDIKVELLAQPPFRVSSDKLNPAPMVSEIDHVSLKVDDLVKSKSFYEKYFNGSPSFFLDMTAKGNMVIDYVSVKFGTLGLKTLTNGQSHGDCNKLAHLCFLVKDVDAAAQTLKSNGVVFDVDPKLSAVGSGYKLAVCLAPEGTRIEFQDRPNCESMGKGQ